MSDLRQDLRKYQTELRPAAGEPTNRRARLDRFGMVDVGSPAGGVGGFHAAEADAIEREVAEAITALHRLSRESQAASRT